MPKPFLDPTDLDLTVLYRLDAELTENLASTFDLEINTYMVFNAHARNTTLRSKRQLHVPAVQSLDKSP